MDEIGNSNYLICKILFSRNEDKWNHGDTTLQLTNLHLQTRFQSLASIFDMGNCAGRCSSYQIHHQKAREGSGIEILFFSLKKYNINAQILLKSAISFLPKMALLFKIMI